jgi:Chitobiase/beta-hexosaminidase C-terminal domain/Beta xylosidase C-terminal Concanavalin A-like domain/FG-GAP-like repeat
MRRFLGFYPLRLFGLSFVQSRRQIHSNGLSMIAISICLVFLMSLGGSVHAQAPVGDAFNESNLNTALWTVKAPVGGAAALSGGELLITVPGGTNHQAFTPLNAVRVIQAVSNANFDVYVKIDSQLTSSAQDSFAGLLVGGDGSNWIYYYAYTDGSNIDLLCASVDGGAQNIRLNAIPFAGYPGPTYLRLQRAGTTYTAYWSADAVNWTSAGTFNDSLVVTHLGPFAGNNNSNPASAPAVSAGFGGFQNTPLPGTAATPTFNPPSGTSFSSTLNVTIADATPGATIYYTTDGSTPTTSSAVYSSVLTLSASTTLKAIATAAGDSQSIVGAASYTMTTAAGAPVPDEFNESSLNTGLWTVRAPVGGTASVSNGDLTLTVPPGSNHDAFVPALDAVQLVQPINNSNFDVAVKIDSALQPNAVYSGMGLMVEGDAKDYIRYELSANGSIALTAFTITSGSQTTRLNASPFSGYAVPVYLRLQRVGTTYNAFWSTDGINWNQLGSFTNSQVVSGLAPYAWNYNATPANAPAVTAKFDWFHNVAQTAPVATATPTFSPTSGATFASTLTVMLADTTPGAVIYYTTDGSTPTAASQGYSSSNPIVLSESATVNAIASASGFTQSAIASASFTFTGGGGAGGIVSDNFDESTLNTSLWTKENPLGDGIVTMIGTAATLNVPQGTIHTLTTNGDNTLRIMQPVGNSNFSVDVRFQSVPEIGNQDEGILVEQDSGDFLHFDVFFNGTVGPQLFAAGVSGGNATTFVNTAISLPRAPLVLRLARNGNVWTGSWSTDGVTFSAAPNFTFDLNVARVGPFAGTSANTAFNSPSFTAIVDYFFASSDPIANQDGPLPYGYTTVDANPPGTVVEKTLADIEGTGRLNPVIGAEAPTVSGDTGPGGIYWYQYPTSGNISGTWIRHTIVPSGNAYEDMVPFDVNGDGAIDIICSYDSTNSGNYQIVWFENPRGRGGTPQTTPWVEHVIGPGYGENNLFLADMDGDGKIDVVTSSSVFFQNSATSWTQATYSSSFRGVGLLDIGSGMGSINLSGTGPAPYNLVWYENPRETGGNARTGKWIMHTVAATPYPCSGSECSDGDAAVYNGLDVNGDGRMDILSGQSEGNQYGAVPPGGLIWWEAPVDRRNGAWMKHTIDANMIDVHRIALGDMDKNGTTDIITAEQDQAPFRRVTVYYNDGKGVLTPETISNAEGHNIWVGDITGTGTLEIFNSGHGYFLNTHPLQIFLNPY